MKQEYLIGIDAGNTSSKVVIFDTEGTIVSTASTPSMHFKKRGEGFEEFDVDELWKLISNCIREALQKAAVAPETIRGIGVTSFGNGVVVVGKNGETIAPGVFSQDHRADDIIAMYQETGVYEKINDIVKGTLFAGEPGPIIRWYKEHEPEVYQKIGGILMFKDYIMYRLTGEFATDMNCFGGSFMIDMDTMEYSRELMKLYGIEEVYDALPKLAGEPSEIVGRVTAEASALTGLKEGTPVVAGMMDILACLVGAGATEEGVYTAVAGSWCINETHSTRIIPNASSNMPYLKKGEYLNCSYTGASGSNYEWFTRVLSGEAKKEAKDRGISYYDVLDELIEMVPIEKAKVFFSPFVAQPSIHVNAKANFFNITMNTSYADICYSVAEGVAFIHKHHVDFLKNAGLPLSTIRLTGGTARSRVWNQIFANVLQVPIIGVDCEETGALGVAIAAGIGAGVYNGYEEAFVHAVKTKEAVLPDVSTYPIYEKRYKEWCVLNEVMMKYWDMKKELSL
ncbi:MAG: FGGY-family carbohydrate kinase [Eubacteriales bacterium]|nr:FGGY-family carbohydrate kinase [Eubacteriales bacterium]